MGFTEWENGDNYTDVFVNNDTLNAEIEELLKDDLCTNKIVLSFKGDKPGTSEYDAANFLVYGEMFNNMYYLHKDLFKDDNPDPVDLDELYKNVKMKIICLKDNINLNRYEKWSAEYFDKVVSYSFIKNKKLKNILKKYGEEINMSTIFPNKSAKKVINRFKEAKDTVEMGIGMYVVIDMDILKDKYKELYFKSV